MRLRARRNWFWGGLVLLAACDPPAPDLQHALELYRIGHLNEARRELALFVRAKPYDTGNSIARQHILSIRQIKRLEQVVVQQWRQGKVQGARRVLGQLRVLHSVYTDSSEVLQLIDLEHPPRVADLGWQPPGATVAVDDPAFGELLPYLLAVLDRHEEMIIHLARQWELVKHETGTDVVPAFASALSSPETVDLLRAVDNAYLELRQINGQTTPLILELSRLSERFDSLLLTLQDDPVHTRVTFEYEFHHYKRRLLRQILTIKARLGAVRRVAVG